MIFTKFPGLSYKNYQRGGHPGTAKSLRVFCLNAQHQKEPMGFMECDKLTNTDYIKTDPKKNPFKQQLEEDCNLP